MNMNMNMNKNKGRCPEKRKFVSGTEWTQMYLKLTTCGLGGSKQ
jgi:hypothetical protein